MPAAPIDRALLEPVLAPRMDGARTLPAEAYTSAAVFDWEHRHLFEQGWVCVGRADELANPGDQRAYRVGQEGILVVRDHDPVLRGFYNTCRHRGHELLEPGASRNLRATASSAPRSGCSRSRATPWRRWQAWPSRPMVACWR